MDQAAPTALEFFAGIGLARLGLERAGFKVIWANDHEPDKRAMYEANFGATPDHRLMLGDIRSARASDLPSGAALAWASSPCTDLSLAGNRDGLEGAESGTFWEFIRIVGEMGPSAPRVAVLENVVGLATSHGGEDLAAAIRAFNTLGYSADVLTIDARRFLPQSRPRLFVVGSKDAPASEQAAPDLRPDWLQGVYGDRSLRTHRARLPSLPRPLTSGFGRFYTEDMQASDDRWWDAARVQAFVGSLSKVQADRLAELQRSAGVKYRTAYRRTRGGVAVWEVRSDDIAGCLRTARGGSSKQAVVRLGNKRLQIRWMTPREYARLMGAGDYKLDAARTNQALFGFGDAVAVPVVEWLAGNYLMPLATGRWPAAWETDMIEVRGDG
ncbi:MAG: DNA cytosine methyltransferase [Bifidobacteriaceae bacterium]|jgi:DNA (cytosine-5)-methyltransferase 1|nr:DNA cytosine methyltransferase [Bifidobacteriaceae bacterium]